MLLETEEDNKKSIATIESLGMKYIGVNEDDLLLYRLTKDDYIIVISK